MTSQNINNQNNVIIYLSVVIPIRNEEKFIIETLDLMTNQDYPKERYELIIVDGLSTDNTHALVDEYISSHPNFNIHIYDNPGLLSSRARNIGAKKAKGKMIAVIDAHVYIPNDQLFKNMEHLKEKSGALALSRPAPLDVPGLDKNSLAYWISIGRKSWIGHSRSSFIYSDYEGFVDPVSAGFAYDRAAFEKVGYFDEDFDAAEDVEFHFRLKQAGIESFTSPLFLIYSYPRFSFKDLFRQQTRYGEGRARFIKKHAEGFTKETPIPLLIFLFFISFPVFFFLIPDIYLLSIPYALVFILYWSILLITGFKEAIARKRFFPGILIAGSIWVTHMGLGWGFLKHLILK